MDTKQNDRSTRDSEQNERDTALMWEKVSKEHLAQEIEDMLRSGEFPQMAHVAAWLLSRRAG